MLGFLGDEGLSDGSWLSQGSTTLGSNDDADVVIKFPEGTSTLSCPSVLETEGSHTAPVRESQWTAQPGRVGERGRCTWSCEVAARGEAASVCLLTSGCRVVLADSGGQPRAHRR